MSESTSDLADDIVPPTLPRHIESRREDFRPWHKVRKQFIRERQWNEMIMRLAERHLGFRKASTTPVGESVEETPPSDELSAGNDHPLTCLLIPGDDLLDLRSLYSQLDPYRRPIKYLGFNEINGSNQQGTRVHIANNEVTSLRGIVPSSQVVRDRFQSISSKQSMAYHYLKEYGPFHVVNLDICDSLFPSKTSNASSYYEAIHRLAEYQMSHQTTPWLLFITTQVEPGTVDGAELNKLCRPARANCDMHPSFIEQLGTLVPSVAFQSAEYPLDLSTLTDEHLVRVFGIALGKWLLRLGFSAVPIWTVRMMASFKYTIRQDLGVEMLSLAFQFTPKFSPPIDETGMSGLKVSSPKTPDELSCAFQILDAVNNVQDVDELLRTDTVLNADMESASANLMERAGYDRSRYLGWIRTQKIDN